MEFLLISMGGKNINNIKLTSQGTTVSSSLFELSWVDLPYPSWWDHTVYPWPPHDISTWDWWVWVLLLHVRHHLRRCREHLGRRALGDFKLPRQLLDGQDDLLRVLDAHLDGVTEILLQNVLARRLDHHCPAHTRKGTRTLHYYEYHHQQQH